jgi:ATP-dependent Lon protease
MSNVRQLPFMALRDIVLFPNSESPIYVGREASVRAIKLAKTQHDGDIVVFTQLKGENNGPIAINDIHHVGTLAKIVASIETTDQTIKGILEGVERVRLKDLEVVDGVTLVTVISEPELDEDSKVDEAEHTSILALLSTWWPDFSRDSERVELQTLTKKRDIVSVVSALCSLASVARIDKPGVNRGWETLQHPPSTRYRELKNLATAQRQKVLEESSYKQKLQCLVDAFRFDVTCRAEDL